MLSIDGCSGRTEGCQWRGRHFLFLQETMERVVAVRLDRTVFLGACAINLPLLDRTALCAYGFASYEQYQSAAAKIGHQPG